MPGVEGFDLRFDLQFGHHGTHRVQHAWRIGHHVIGLGEIHRSAIQRADFRPAFCDMLYPIFGADHVGRI